MHIQSLFQCSKAKQNLLIYSLLYCKPELYSSSFILFCITLSVTLSLFGFQDYYSQASLKSTVSLPHTTASLPTERANNSKDPKPYFHSQTCITNLETISQSDLLYKPLQSDLTLWDGAHTVQVTKQGHLCTSIWLGPQEGASTFLLPGSGLTEFQRGGRHRQSSQQMSRQGFTCQTPCGGCRGCSVPATSRAFPESSSALGRHPSSRQHHQD